MQIRLSEWNGSEFTSVLKKITELSENYHAAFSGGCAFHSYLGESSIKLDVLSNYIVSHKVGRSS